jgi:protein-tyrosine phosphatase
LQYGLTFFVLATACIGLAFALWDRIGWGVVLPLYVAFSFGLLAVAYAGAGPRLLLKRTTGHRSMLSWLFFAPYHLLNTLTFGVYRRLSREPVFVQVVPKLYFGRRLSAREAASVPCVNILDLASEFSATRWPQTVQTYRSLPLLDATSPTENELRSAVAWITNATASGPVYVHCALGHGRSACVVIAYLLHIGAVQTAIAGERFLRSLRPGVRLHRPQRQLLLKFESLPPAQSPNQAKSAEANRID